MGNKSIIEWTESTWNPATGCTKVSPGCKNCYAERLATRLQKMHNPKYANGFKFQLQPRALDLPLTWTRPRKIFVNSMSDLFHEEMTDEYLVSCFEIMKKANWHVFQVLTKRPARMLAFSRKCGEIPDNVWVGTSVEMRAYLPRIDILRKVCAKTRFVSFEPLLGSCLDGGSIDLSLISWAITGGESDYKNPRPANLEWFREIRDACLAQNVNYFHKQNGGAKKCKCHNAWGCRLLDNVVWNEMPPAALKPNISV